MLANDAHVAGFTRRIVGVPKAESDTILQFLFEQIAHNVDFHARIKWGHNDIAFWDNRVSRLQLARSKTHFVLFFDCS